MALGLGLGARQTALTVKLEPMKLDMCPKRLQHALVQWLFRSGPFLHFPAVGDSTNHPEPTFRMWEATAATPRHLFGWSPFVMSWCLVQVKRSSSEGSIRSSKIADLERQVRLAGRKTGPYLYL